LPSIVGAVVAPMVKVTVAKSVAVTDPIAVTFSSIVNVD
jgi:hypothetical protein